MEGLARAASNLPADQASAAGLQIGGVIVEQLDSLASGILSICSFARQSFTTSGILGVFVSLMVR